MLKFSAWSSTPEVEINVVVREKRARLTHWCQGMDASVCVCVYIHETTHQNWHLRRRHMEPRMHPTPRVSKVTVARHDERPRLRI